MSDALATRDPAILVAQTDLPSPVFRGAHMVRALADYRELQKALDESMPDQLMTLDGKPFRKKGYWRAIAVAFNLTVEPITDAAAERSVIGVLDSDGSENYVYTVAYRATAPNGRSAVGDGTCAAAEKQKGRMKATEHNCRSHAHTRAFNRSVSNLVGFGEVSAEEVERDEHGSEPAPVAKRADGSALVTEVGTTIGPGKKWTKHLVTFDDGRSGSTFDESLAKMAIDAKAAGALLIPAFEQKGQYVNLIELKPLHAAGRAGKTNGTPDTIISREQVVRFHAVARTHGWTDVEGKELLAANGYDSSTKITVQDYDRLVDELKARQPDGTPRDDDRPF